MSLGACTIALLSDSLAQVETKVSKADSVNGHPTALVLGLFVVGSTLSIYTHEVGHLSFDYMMGATSARIKFIPPTTSASFPLKASTFQTSFPALAGPMTTRLLSEGVNYILDHTSPPPCVETLAAAWYLAMRFDLPWQITSSAIWHLTQADNQRRDDIFQGLIRPWIHRQGSRNFVYTALILSQVLDIYFERHDIANNYCRLVGRPVQHPSSHSATLGLLPDSQTGGITLSCRVLL